MEILPKNPHPGELLKTESCLGCQTAYGIGEAKINYPLWYVFIKPLELRRIPDECVGKYK
jgi:hypothetical protein